MVFHKNPRDVPVKVKQGQLSLTSVHALDRTPLRGAEPCNMFRPFRFSLDIIACALSLCLTGCSGPDSSPDNFATPPSRVIWIAIDSLRADHLGEWGYQRDTSPWIDDLAERSATFTWAIAPSNRTVRSVAAYFSGIPASQLGNPYENRLPEDVTTLAETLSSAGVRCTAFTANIVIPPSRGFAQGFADYRIISSPSTAHSRIDDIIADVQANYRPIGGREFVYIHTMDVHMPYRPPYPYGSMFTAPYSGNAVSEGKIYLEDRSESAYSLHPFWSELHNVTQQDIDFLVGLYDGAVRYTDEQLPKLLEALKWDPSRDVLIISADHGESLYETSWWGHFATLTPAEIRVPLIVHYPGVKPVKFERPVSLLDLYPTIAQLLSASVPAGIKGVSLIPELRGDRVPPRDVYSETALTLGATSALIHDDYWYILSTNRSQLEPWHPWPIEEFLYRYLDDSEGRLNLIAAEVEAANRLNDRLREFNPLWAQYTPDRVRGGDDAVSFGEDLLRELPNDSPAAVPPTEINGSWQFDIPLGGVTFQADGLTPWEPLFVEVPYSLESGRLTITLSPVAYRWPGTVKEQSVWEYVIQKPTEGHNFSAVVVPRAESVTLRITPQLATRGTISRPTLRRIQPKWLAPWPRSPEDGAVDPELIQRMKALGYV